MTIMSRKRIERHDHVSRCLVDARVDEPPCVTDPAVDSGQGASRAQGLACGEGCRARDFRMVQGAMPKPPAESADRGVTVGHRARDVVVRLGGRQVRRELELNEEQERRSLGNVHLLHAVNAVFVENLETRRSRCSIASDIDAAGIAGCPRLTRRLSQFVDQREG